MLYNLLVPWASEWTALNVFRYITFRSMAALITALVLSILLGPRFIAWLRRLKCGQHILHEVTAHACKEGTPTMGGVMINENAEVISANTHKPIPGLYAGGEVAGGVHGASRLGTVAVIDALTFGMIAGENFAKMQ